MENKQEELIDVTDTVKSPVKKKPVKSKAVTVQKKDVVIQSESSMLLKMAIDKDLDVEKFKQLIDLQNQQEERQCKKDFDFHFAKMQKEFKPVQRTKSGYSNKYAPLEDLQTQYSPIISDHGFSYKWKELTIDTGKRVILIITGYGYTDSDTTFDVPNLEKTNQMNSIQVLAAMSSYGKRYTFTSGFGIIIEDEDTDGNLTFNDGVEYAEQIVWLKSCTSKADLLDVFKKIVEELKKNNDTIGKGILTAIYTDLKKELK